MIEQRQLRGIGVSPGVVRGRLVFEGLAPGIDPTEPPTTDSDAAYVKVCDALAKVAETLRHRAQTGHEDARSMIEATAMMAEDPGLRAAIHTRLRAGAGPTHAVTEAVGQFSTQLEALGGYMAQRVTDLNDVRNRTIAVLRGLLEPGIPRLDTPAIIVAEDLAPSEAAALDPALCLGILTWEGGPTGHTSILAATLGIPAVVQVKGLESVGRGAEAVFDGSRGEVYINPTEDEVVRLQRFAERRSRLIGNGTEPGQTRDGQRIALMANIGTVAGAKDAVAARAEGVGLFRTEFLFLDRDAAPSLAEQTETYRQVFDEFPGEPVVVRTLDAGADKPMRFVDQTAEENPALGRRGIRLSMANEALLDQQLRAIAAAASQSSAMIRVMAPMVATAAEARWFALKVKSHGLPSAGVMIEVPSAALGARHICQETDFVSIGTNDLAQYVMAADRLEGALSNLLDPWQPAVLKLLQLTCEGAAAAGNPVGVCGEAASEPDMALVLVGLGVTSLSMTPALIPAVRAALSLHSLAQCQELAHMALRAADPHSARAAVLDLASPYLADIL